MQEVRLTPTDVVQLDPSRVFDFRFVYRRSRLFPIRLIVGFLILGMDDEVLVRREYTKPLDYFLAQRSMAAFLGDDDASVATQ